MFGPKNPMSGYRCRTCRQYHSEVPLSYGAPAPALWYGLSEEDRIQRAELTSDICVIDDRYFFVVGNLELPIQGSDQQFSWDVWVSLSEKSFKRMAELWESPGRQAEAPYFGWLSTALPTYPETLHLKTHVHTREVGRRPLIEVEHSSHPLSVEQRKGISWRRVHEIAERVRHQR